MSTCDVCVSVYKHSKSLGFGSAFCFQIQAIQKLTSSLSFPCTLLTVEQKSQARIPPDTSQVKWLRTPPPLRRPAIWLKGFGSNLKHDVRTFSVYHWVVLYTDDVVRMLSRNRDSLSLCTWLRPHGAICL